MVDGEGGIQQGVNQRSCPNCGAPVSLDAKECPECGAEMAPKFEPGYACPVCASSRYAPESGDLARCLDCGNVYYRVEERGWLEGWRWKFFLGLAFIIIGNFGFALISYLHNVARWSPLGDMYLGYGWLDQFLGALGVVIFGVGVVLFGLSFKRERTLDCPSCGTSVSESELLPEPDVEEEAEEKEVKEALVALEAPVECPNCGSQVTIYDEVCPSCGVSFAPAPEEEVKEERFERVEEKAMSTEAGIEPELLETLEALEEELEEKVSIESERVKMIEPLEETAPKTGTELDEIEAREIEGIECPVCGVMADKNAKDCPVCGTKLGGD